MAAVRVSIIDVGSNTVRLLVADRKGGRVTSVREERAYVGLGEEVERHGFIPAHKLEHASAEARRYATIARCLGAEAGEVIVTAPGRQSRNAGELVSALAEATNAPVRVLSADEEGRLAFVGALASVDDPPETVAVCDVGGGSTEIAVGTPAGGPSWLRSFDVGSLRLTRRFAAEDPPGKKAVALIRAAIAEELESAVPPLPRAALATGGTARALAKVAGPELGPAELEDALRRLSKRPAREVAKRYRIDPERALTLVAGAAVLAEVQQRLQTPLVVCRAGLREAAALALVDRAAAAA